ncbi:MAG: hypothetical protein IKO20_04435 [Bacteroidaceae bacterium]|nr:hypothetical protein [Bacteroidaceae bacterium]
MLTPELEQLIQYALQDGVLTDKERSVLMRKAQDAGVDLDEFEMILDAKLHEIQKAAAAEAPKPSSNKHGEVRKCPACGAMVSAFTTRCSECGFEFNNVEANKSANTLFEKLQALEMEKARELATHEESKNKQLMALSERHNSGGTLTKIFAHNGDAQNEERDDLIRTFEKGAQQIERKYMDAKINMIKVYAVPNTKGDLLELLSMASSSAYDNDGVIGREEEVWLQKTDQIYQKLVICAAGDTITLNQATNMIVSLIKRLPKEYKNFTRIPKELRDKINVELKAQKAEKNEEFKENLFNILKGWRGITLGVALLLFIIDCFAQTGIFFIALIVLIVVGKMTWRAIKEAKNDLLY